MACAVARSSSPLFAASAASLTLIEDGTSARCEKAAVTLHHGAGWRTWLLGLIPRQKLIEGSAVGRLGVWRANRVEHDGADAIEGGRRVRHETRVVRNRDEPLPQV
jgi:hypothetical protein